MVNSDPTQHYFTHPTVSAEPRGRRRSTPPSLIAMLAVSGRLVASEWSFGSSQVALWGPHAPDSCSLRTRSLIFVRIPFVCPNSPKDPDAPLASASAWASPLLPDRDRKSTR